MNLKAIFSVLTLFLLFLISCNNQSEECKNSTKKKGKVKLENNKVTAIAITTKASDREKLAAHEFIAYLSKITGREIPLLNVEDSVISDGTIAIGQLAVRSGLVTSEELDSVRNDGFVIKINKKTGAICGYRDLGTLYGVYELLKQLGVKYYAHDCEVIPQSESLTIPNILISKKPSYDLRSIFKLDVYFHKMKPSPKLGYTPSDDLGYPGDLGAPEERNWVHSASFLIPYRMYGKEHPEYFALQKNGQRYKPGMTPPGHLCLSNDSVKKLSSERLLFLIEKQKERSFFVVTHGDGRSESWCQCKSCKALDAIPGNHMTDRFLQYVNYNARSVAKTYPDKKILTLAYTEATSRPPVKILPDPNLMVMYCPYPPQTNCQSHGLYCPENKEGLEELKGWVSKCPNNMYIFDYPRGYNTWFEPFGSFYAMVEKMNLYTSFGIRGVVECVVPTSFRDLFIFVLGRLFWDTNANVEALVDEFMSAYYGSAAPAMREYFNYMYHEINSQQIHQMCERPNPELVTSEFADKSLEIIHRAQQSVAQDSLSLSRVDAEKFCVLWSDINQRNTVNGQVSVNLDEYILRFNEMVRIARDMKIMQVSSRHNFKTWVKSVAPLWLQSEPWYEDPAIDPLLEQPENLFKL